MSSSSRCRIGLVTSKPEKLHDYFPSPTEPDFLPTEPPFAPDDQLLVDELRRHGYYVQPVIWGCDIAALAQAVDRLVIRSPWDFLDSDAQRQRFLSWIAELDGAGIAVDNHPRLLIWLIDKQYLKDFEVVGVPIVPTRVVAQGATVDLLDLFESMGPLIVKPGISAAGVGLVFLESSQAATNFQTEFESRCRTTGYLVQPFVPEIRTEGEWSLVYLGGTYSHAVHKRPAEGKILVHAEQGGSIHFAEPPANVRAVGDLIPTRLPEAFALQQSRIGRGIRFPPLYLRVDVIESKMGPLLSECEGVEPELFFRARPGSEQRFRQLLEERVMS
jgi:glutathione synthase/RimK-type ligase-like ATP-grasp enzyme